MKIATWNVNSLNVRMPHLKQWLAAAQPDIVALQETKLEDAKFPDTEIAALGYRCVFSGQKTYNGVALLARHDMPADIVTDIPGLDDPQRRILIATVGDLLIANLYVVNGQAVGSPKFDYKLRWLAAARAMLAEEMARHPRLVVLGDFNIAPTDLDVWDPQAVHGATHVSPPERAALGALLDWGLTDLFRVQFPDVERLYSWWDYRAGNFHKGFGMRIDLVLGSPSLVDRVRWVLIDRNARKGKQPSDHAPVIVDYDL